MRVGDDRPSSELLADLHVYVVPHNLWQEPLHSASNEIISNTISAGFLRVHPETLVISLRDEIPQQFAGNGFELVPHEYVFLKSVGRCLTRVKVKQEREMKVKHFLPPHAYCPEIFLMEPTAAMRNLMSSEAESSRQSFHPQNASFRQGSKSPGHGVYHRSSQNQQDLDSSRNQKYQSSHIDSGFGTYSGQHDLSNESPKRSNRPHFNESTASDDDDVNKMMAGGYGHGQGSQHSSPGKSSRSPDRGSKRSQHFSPNKALENGMEGAPYYGRETSRTPHEDDENRRPGGKGEYGSPDTKGSRSQIQSQDGHKSGTKRTTSENSDAEFADQLGGRQSTPLPLSEQQENLREQLERIRKERRNLEAKREEMVKKAKYLQSKTSSKRNHARDLWKKRYFEEKKKTPPLEEKTNKLRLELENLHRKIVGQMEGGNTRMPKSEKVVKPSQQNSMRINATKLNHEIEELQRRVDDAKMKLTGEVKIRNQAESELRALKTELTQRKINVTLTRSQKLETINMDQEIYKRAQSPYDSM